MPRLSNGTIMILAPDHTGAGRKAIDLKVMQRFPIFDLNSKSGVFKADGSVWDTSEYRHLSVPLISGYISRGQERAQDMIGIS